MLNSRHIEIFFSIYKYKTLTKTAKILNVSQPALSKALQYAEHKLNFKLFSRSGRLLEPTPEADILFRHAEKINLLVKEFGEIAKNLNESPTNYIDIGVTPSLGAALLPSIVSDFSKDNPEVRFNIINSQSHDLINQLHDLSHDLVICFNPAKNDMYKSFTITTGNLVLISPKSDNMQTKDSVALKTLDGKPLIKIRNVLSGLDASDTSEDFSLDGVLVTHNIQPDWIAKTESFHVAKKMVEQGIGSAIIDSITAHTGTDNMTVQSITPKIKFKIVCLTNPQKPLSIAAKAFLDFLKKYEL